MAELKTKQTGDSVEAFLDGIADEKRRQDCYTILGLMKQVTKAEPKMWGTSIVGFGEYHYKYASGREGDSLLTGFSPRKQNLTLYLGCDVDQFNEITKTLGKFKTGKGCLYIKKIEDIDLPALKELIRQSVEQMSKTSA